MDPKKPPAEEAEALDNRMRQPDDNRGVRRQAYAEAAMRGDSDPARLGAELAGEGRPREESETADALIRSAEEAPPV